MRDPKLYLVDIKESIEKIQEYTKEINYKDFSENNEKIDAVVRNLEIIGEAVKHISKDIKQKHKNVNWEDIVGMRNIITHEYFGVDLEIIWKTVKEKLPELKNKIEEILQK
ncbi:MAG: DUF86 domain-containing protein [Elusimicrobia bacterium]|nr:DUF86 domain-containing protein [Elusimicrobiota bacterium]